MPLCQLDGLCTNCIKCHFADVCIVLSIYELLYLFVGKVYTLVLKQSQSGIREIASTLGATAHCSRHCRHKNGTWDRQLFLVLSLCTS